MAYKQECSSLRAQLAAALVQGEVVRENREVSPHLEQTVTELTAKLRSLEESWREEREKLLEENKRLEAVGQQRWDMGRGTGGRGHKHVAELTSSSCPSVAGVRSCRRQFSRSVNWRGNWMLSKRRWLERRNSCRCGMDMPSCHTHTRTHYSAHLQFLCVFCVRLR